MDFRYMRRIFFQTMELLRGQNSIECLKELEKTQWLSLEDLKKIQDKKVHQLIEHAYDNVPYYHEILKRAQLGPEDIITVKDLQKLPVLTKDLIRKNFKNLIAKNYSDNDRIMASTGASTGEPLQFFVPKNRGYAWGAYWRAMNWYGLEIGDTYALIWGNLQKRTFNYKIQTKISQILRGYVYLDAIDMTEENIKTFIKKIQQRKPVYLDGYASAAYILAKYVKDHEINDIHFKTTITSAEKLYEYQREILEEVFHSQVFEYYGCGEIISVGFECPNHTGYHITLENIVLEILTENRIAANGEPGLITITDLNNYIMPFIRYQNEDIGILSNTPCSCGRNLPLLKSVEGRITDILYTKLGYVSSPVLTLIFKNLPVKRYQILQIERDYLLIKIIKDTAYSDKDSQYIINTIHQHAGEDMRIDLEFCNDIPLTKQGKHRVVISRSEFSNDHDKNA